MPGHGFQSLCKGSSMWYVCLNWQQEEEEFWKLTFLNKSSTDCAIYAISWIHALCDDTDQSDVSKVGSDRNWKWNMKISNVWA